VTGCVEYVTSDSQAN